MVNTAVVRVDCGRFFSVFSGLCKQPCHAIRISISNRNNPNYAEDFGFVRLEIILIVAYVIPNVFFLKPK